MSSCNLSANPRTVPSARAKLCTYDNWFQSFSSSNPYFILPVSRTRMKRFLRFRLSSHTLPIETGRRARPMIRRTDRLCPHCSGRGMGDETFIMKGIWCLNARHYTQDPIPFSFPATLTVNATLLFPKSPHASFQLHTRLSRHDEHLTFQIC